MVNWTLSGKGGINAPPSFPRSARSFGLIFLPKVINAEDRSSFLLMTFWRTSSYTEHNRISKAQQTHREVKGSYENWMKTRCPRLIALTWLARAPPTLPRPLTVQLPLHTIQAFKQQLHRNGDGSSKIQRRRSTAWFGKIQPVVFVRENTQRTTYTWAPTDIF